jgi:hypothetical protein
LARDERRLIEIAGTFEKQSASGKFRSPELTSAILDIRIQAASVHTGSNVKGGKLKGKISSMRSRVR